MATEQILALLIGERDKLNRAIEALGAPVGKRRGRPRKDASAAVAADAAPAKARKKRTPMTAEQRSAQAKRMKAFWAAKRKAAK